MTREERKKQREAIVEYRKAGHYVRECCERFGVKEDYVYAACRGIDYPWIKDIDTMRQAAIKQNENRLPDEQNAINMINERTPQFIFYGNYTGSDGSVDLKCKECGTVINRKMCAVRHKQVRCPECHKKELEKKKTIREAERISKINERERLKYERNIKKRKQLTMCECSVCGNMFIPYGNRTKYCSDECMKRISNARNKDKRIRKIKTITDDNNITLERLYVTNGGECSICGTICDWNDYELRNDGVFIAGNNYPSIDHVVPISKGGRHAWDNVQLAHRICNTRKSNRMYILPSRA